MILGSTEGTGCTSVFSCFHHILYLIQELVLVLDGRNAVALAFSQLGRPALRSVNRRQPRFVRKLERPRFSPGG
jgi:hypothetical protein